MEDRTWRRRWGGRNDGDTGWVEHRVAKTSQELSFKIHNSLFFLTVALLWIRTSRERGKNRGVSSWTVTAICRSGYR